MFKAMLSKLYKRIGDEAEYASVSGTQPRPTRVILDQHGGAMLDGAHVGGDPSVRVAAADYPEGVKRGDFFTVGGITWRAREDGVPLLDGAELQVPLMKVKP